MMLFLFLSIFSVYSAERNETSTNDQDYHQHHQHHHPQHHELLISAVSSCKSAVAIDTQTTTALIATSCSLSSNSSLNATMPLAAAAALHQANYPNKRLIAPKRRSYRNHNVRSSVVTQVTRSVRKRR